MTTKQKIEDMQAEEQGATNQSVENTFPNATYSDVAKPNWDWRLYTFRVKPERVLTAGHYWAKMTGTSDWEPVLLFNGFFARLGIDEDYVRGDFFLIREKLEEPNDER